MAELAINGGPKAKTVPYGSGKRFGLEELVELAEALQQNTLFYWHGNKVKQFQKEFAAMYGVKHCVTTSSGTASIHVALGALRVSCGDEVITSPITDMGTVIGILYQNAIPIFADLDPNTYNMDPKSVEERITDRTKVILVVHLAGNPCDMDAIMDIARRHNLKVVEDCAQSYLCEYKGKLAGTIGDIGCFSLNDFKHISAGDAGMVITDNDELAAAAMKFADKNYGRGEIAVRFPEFLAPNYRMCELHGAVALAQLRKLRWITSRRNEIGDRITAGISDLPGLYPHKVTEGGRCTYWFYMFRVDEKTLGVSRKDYVAALAAEGIPASAGYIPTCVYEYPVFTQHNAYPGTDCPWGCPKYGRMVEYRKGLCPNAELILDTAVRLPVNEFFTDLDVEETIAGIRKVTEYFLAKKDKEVR